MLGLGRWREGFTALADANAGYMAPPWRGCDLKGQRITLRHTHGFGDSIMLVRYVPRLKAIAGEVTIEVPKPLKRLLAPIAAPVRHLRPHLHCSFFELMTVLDPEPVPKPPYLIADGAWWPRLYDKKRRIGIAWNSMNRGPDGYDRQLTLDYFLQLLGSVIELNDYELVSLQHHERAQARDRGITIVPFIDFAELAAIVMQMHAVVSIDAAVLNLAGALDHPNSFAMLAHLASWRWEGSSPFYPGVTICRQPHDGDWASAFAQLPKQL